MFYLQIPRKLFFSKKESGCERPSMERGVEGERVYVERKGRREEDGRRGRNEGIEVGT